MVVDRFTEEQVAVLSPIIDKQLTMMGAARDAFNRHSHASLGELHSLGTFWRKPFMTWLGK